MSDPAVMHGAIRHLRRTERRRLYRLLGDRELLARFLADRDEAAFEEVVARHGPMVRAVCRRVLGPSIDADDAFQAAFLVLLRRARSIRRADLLAGWLCAVAYRTARQALRRRARRGARERLLDELPEPARADDPPRDWLPLFDAAVQRLPAKYREPVVLCELQGLSRRDASARLGLTEGTLSSRLGRARDLLRRRLGPYGFPLAIGSAVAPAVVPEALTASTAAAAVHVSAASVSAVVIGEGVLTAMLASKLKAGALAGTAVVVLGVVAGLPFAGPVSGAGGPPAKDGAAGQGSREGGTAQAARRKPDPKPARLAAEYEPFQGRWDVTAAEHDGADQPPQAIGVDEPGRLPGTTLTTGGEAKADAAEAFVIDPRAKPPTIDFVLTQFTPDNTGALSPRPVPGGLQVRVGRPARHLFPKEGRRRAAARPGSPRRRTRGATVSSCAGRTSEAGPSAGRARLRVPVSAYDIDGRGHRRRLIGAATRDAEPGKGRRPRQGRRRLGVGGRGRSTRTRRPPNWTPGATRRAANAPSSGGRACAGSNSCRPTGPMDLGNQPGAASFVAYVELDGTRSPKWFTLYATETRRPAEQDLDIRVTRRPSPVRHLQARRRQARRVPAGGRGFPAAAADGLQGRR